MAINKEQYEKIDLMKLFSDNNHAQWNMFLTNCYNNRDVSRLIRVMRGLQMGMDDMSKKKLNVPKMNLFFVRLQTSIEKTLKKIYKEVYPEICDDPLKAKDNLHKIGQKRKRDADFEAFLRRHSY